MPVKLPEIIWGHYQQALVRLFYGVLFLTTLVLSNHAPGWGHIENFYYFYVVSFGVCFFYAAKLLWKKPPLVLSVNRIDGLFILYSGYLLIHVPVIDGAAAVMCRCFFMVASSACKVFLRSSYSLVCGGPAPESMSVSKNNLY